MEVFGPTCAEGLIENLDGIVGAIGLRRQTIAGLCFGIARRVPPEPRQSTISNQQSAILSASFRAAVVK
jgi:hypothetical protein